MEDGLANNTIYSLMQDSKGHLWLATNNGVSRFDGYRFINFTVKDGLLDNVTYLCSEDATGRIWIAGNSSELCYYLNGQFHPYRFNDSIRAAGMGNSPIRSFLYHNDTIFMGFDLSGCFYIDSSGIWGKIQNPPGLTVKNFSSGVLEYLNWQDGMKKGLVHFEGKAYSFQYDEIAFLTRSFKVNDQLFVSSGTQLFTVEGDSLKLTRNDRNITSMISDRQGGLWIGYGSNGIKSFFRSTQGFQEISHELPGVRVLSLVEDFEGGIWVASTNGLYYKPPNPFPIEGNSEVTRSSRSQVEDVLLTSPKEAFVSFTNGELWLFSEKQPPKMFFRALPLMYGNQLMIYNEANEKIMLQPEIIDLLVKELKRFAVRKSRNSDPSFQFRNSSYSEIQSDGSDGYWISHFKGLIHLSRGRIKEVLTEEDVVNYPGKILDFRPGPMLLDQRHRMFYYVLEIGLCELKDGRLFYLGNQHPLFRTTMSDIRWFGKDTLMMGSREDGLVIWAGDSIWTIDETTGLSNNSVSSISVDEDGIVWVGTDNGLNKINLLLKNPVMHVLTTLQGLPSNTITEVKNRGNELWVGASKGLVVLDRSRIKSNRIPPFLEFTGLKVFESDTTLLKEYNFSHDQNYFTFSYTGIAFRHQGTMTYEYQLEGLENTWQKTSLREVRYNSLPPGKYTFKVVAFNEDKTPSKMASINFIINPPYWKTWWFYTLEGLSLAGLLYLVFRVRTQHLKDRAEAVEAKLEGMRSQMNPHFTFNTLNAIQEYIQSKDTVAATDYLAQFAGLIRKVLENSRYNMIPFNEEIETLEIYLKLEQMRSSRKLEYKISIHPSVKASDIEIPPAIIQPYVENAILHGILPREDSGQVHIDFTMEAEELMCIVTDNGIGREKARAMKSSTFAKKKSLGMEITRDRLKLLRRKRKKEEPVNITDLKDENGMACGTRVEIRLPFRRL